MGLTLSNALEIYPLSLCRIVAGRQGLQREVTSVNIVEIPEVSRWMRGGELLFTAGFAFQGDPGKGCAMLRDLAEHNITALGVKPGTYLPTIPQEMIDIANELGFPLIEIPRDKPFMDLMEPILEKLINEQLFALKRVEEIHTNLLDALLTGEGLPKICGTLSQIIRTPSFVLDLTGKIIASSITDRALLTECEYTLQVPLSTLADEELEGLQALRHTILPGEEGAGYAVVPINIGGSRVAYLISHSCNGELSNIDYIALEYAGTLASIILMQKQSLLEKEWQMRGECLEDLLNHNYSDDAVMVNRASYYHIDLGRKFMIFAIDIDHFVTSIKENNWKLKEQQVHKTKRDIFESIRHGIALYDTPIMILNKSDHVVALATIENGEGKKRVRGHIYTMVQDLNRCYPEVNFSAGLGRVCQALGEAATSYQEAMVALKCARSMHRSEKVVDFEELGIFRILYEFRDSQVTRDFYKDSMSALLEYDQEKKGGLIETLSAYFRCNQNMRKTADTLFMHKNTVIYRLRLIEQITGLKLDNSENVFQLQLCLKLMELL